MRRFLQTIEEEPDINLIPIMNLFVVLILILLFMVVFFSISVINASVLTVSDEVDLD
jgi:hypothetical protein